jgi:endoglucanase
MVVIIEMKHFRKIILYTALLTVLFLLPSVTSQAATPVAAHGRLAVKGSKIVDKKGKTFQLKGVSTHGLSWYPEYVSEKSFKTLRDKWGANTVRLALYTAEYNGYCTGNSSNRKQLKKTIDKGVTAATDLGMYVIIDWHILSDGNPNTYKKQAISFFKEMAKKYKKNKNVIYEICNEPNSGTSWKQIKSYSKSVIAAIRKIDKNALILVGTPNWSQDVDVAAASPITGYKNIAYTFHFYANTHQEAYRRKVEQAIAAGLPIFVSEFGICDASGSGGINKSEANKWMKLLNKHKISYICWNLSNKNESSALIKSSCKKLSGWKTSDLSASGKWLVKTMKK